MQSNSTSLGQGSNGDHSKSPLKNKKPYIRPKAAMVTPDRAEAEVKAKAALGSPDSNNCLELIAEARKGQVGRKRCVTALQHAQRLQRILKSGFFCPPMAGSVDE